jgi:hypothetical protein
LEKIRDLPKKNRIKRGECYYQGDMRTPCDRRLRKVPTYLGIHMHVKGGAPAQPGKSLIIHNWHLLRPFIKQSEADSEF